ncbi:hypothetical protein [Fluviibacter sp.]
MRWQKLCVIGAVLLQLAACSTGMKRQAHSSDQAGEAVTSVVGQPKDPSENLAKPQTKSCPSNVTLNIVSSNYSGVINIEFRQGKRPGSKKLQTSKINTSGQVKISNVCAGTYFFSFSTPDSPSVSVTQYFDVMNNGTQYSSPVITVTYTRAKTQNAVQTVGRGSL